MFKSLAEFFSSEYFMPHGHCYLWRPELLSLHAISDFLIGLAYLVIAVILYVLVRKIRLPFSSVVLSFGVFIGACGATHWMEVWTLWFPDYWWSGLVKAVTAVASVTTGVWLFRLRHQIVRVAELTKAQNFQALAEAVPNLVWTTDAAGSPDYLNHQWYDYTGLNPSEPPALSWHIPVFPEDIPALTDHWKASTSERKDFQIEFRLRRHDGVYRWFLARATPLKDSGGNVLKWVGTSTDIDDAKQHETRLRESVRMRDEFLSVASHELKTPITALKLQLELLSRRLGKRDDATVPKEEVSASLAGTIRQVGQLSQLIADMLDASRLDRGQLRITREPLDLSRLLTEIIERAGPLLASRGVECSVRVTPAIWTMGDPLRLEQAVMNLLTNAVKYGEGKPIEVVLETETPGTVRLLVRDHGIGIPVENQQRIFDRFERAVSSRDISGLGLGLYITRQIAELHDGRITVQSVPGEGSTFSLFLPTCPLPNE